MSSSSIPSPPPPSMIDAYVAVSKAMNSLGNAARYQDSVAADTKNFWSVEMSVNPFSTDLSHLQTPVAIGSSDDLSNYISNIAFRVDGQAVGTIGNLDVPKLKSLAKPSPFGRGSQTVFDESVRKAMEISADRISFGSPYDITALANTFQKMVNAKMAPRLMRFASKLYKLTMYEEGGFFDEHVDTLHGPNHLATALVCIPTKHEGGALIVQKPTSSDTSPLADNSLKFDFSGDSDNNLLQWCAFYTDCKHRVEPVTKGTRIVLQFDLYAEAYDPSEGDLESSITGGYLRNWSANQVVEYTEDSCNEEYLSRIRKNLIDYFAGKMVIGESSTDERPSKKKKTDSLSESVVARLAFLLRHRYRAGSVVPTLLKGSDSILYNYLDAHSESEYQLSLSPVLLFTSEGHYDSSDEVVLTASPFSDEDVLRQCREKDTQEAAPTEPKTILIPGSKHAALECVKHVDAVEHTGNESQNEENFYYGAALVITPNVVKDQ